MKCELCGSNRRDSIKYGEFLTKKGKGVHTNCLYLSSAMMQNGKDEEGILGFLPNDIAAEKKRVSIIKCCYCGKNMANIGCCEKRCSRSFHMICGIENGAMNQFIGTFRSFCHRHIRKVNYRPKKGDECCICYEKIFNESTRFNAVKMIRAPCCRNGWFHKYCLQQFAKNAGYFFKCPLCNDNKKFKENMSFWGIFVQNRDAEWELVPNAYAELLERPSVCAAETCRNVKGRAQHQKSNPLLYCIICGSVAMHRHCAAQSSHSFECDNCKSILRADSGRESMSSQQLYVGRSDSHDAVMSDAENSDVDVCGSTSEEENDCDVTKRQIIEKSNPLQKLQIVNELDAPINSKEEDGCGVTKRQIIEKSNALQKLQIVNELDAPINSSQSQCKEKNDSLNISCIAQRTRRKSVKMCLPSIKDQETTDDDNQSTSSYKSSNCIQVFDYDESNDAITDNIQTEEVCNTDMTNNKTPNSLDLSCVANRTRRRFLNKSETEIKSVCQKHEGESHAINSQKSYQSQQVNHIFVHKVCEDSNTESLPHNNVEKEISYGDNSGSGLMNYFFELLREVKCNSQNKHQPNKSSRDEKVDNNDVKPDPLNISCIANRTRRRLNSVNTNEPIKDIDAEMEDSEPAANNNCTTSSQESYRSTTYFGRTVQHQNAADIKLNYGDNDNVNKAKKTVSRKRSHDEEHKCDLTECTPSKIPAITKNESNYKEIVTVDNDNCQQTVSSENSVQLKLESQENILEKSCIANRTRRKSTNVNHLRKLTGIASRKQRYISVDEQALSNCQNRALTSNNIRLKVSHSSDTLTSSAIRRGQRRRVPSRRLLQSDDAYGKHKSLLGHSPIVQRANWSNIKEITGAYYTHHGKLKSERSAQQARNTPAAQTHFARSYQLLLECNDNHYASTSGSAQRV